MDNNGYKVIIVHYGDVILYPPVITLIQCLLNKGVKVTLISSNSNSLSTSIRTNSLFHTIDIKFVKGRTIVSRLKRRLLIGKLYRDCLKNEVGDNSIVWTTTDLTVRILNKSLLNQKKHVMQMMEMVEWMPLFDGAKILRFDIREYAQHAWKTVVPEINRAYITKAKWNLKKLPYVLPNKPYTLEYGSLSEKTKNAIELIKAEKKKIILYLGIIGFDRDLTNYAKAIKLLGDNYCLYIIGSVGDQVKNQFNEFLNNYSCVKYLGYFPAPQHLAFLKYVHIGLLPYTTSFSIGNANPLNALYCAPNKIFEYAGFGIPMVGSDLMGLRVPFERYNIGCCCDNEDYEDIKRAIIEVDNRFDEMSGNCTKFYESVNVEDIVSRIISD